jgi:hypothetical protein
MIMKCDGLCGLVFIFSTEKEHSLGTLQQWGYAPNPPAPFPTGEGKLGLARH